MSEEIEEAYRRRIRAEREKTHAHHSEGQLSSFTAHRELIEDEDLLGPDEDVRISLF